MGVKKVTNRAFYEHLTLHRKLGLFDTSRSRVALFVFELLSKIKFRIFALVYSLNIEKSVLQESRFLGFEMKKVFLLLKESSYHLSAATLSIVLRIKG